MLSFRDTTRALSFTGNAPYDMYVRRFNRWNNNKPIAIERIVTYIEEQRAAGRLKPNSLMLYNQRVAKPLIELLPPLVFGCFFCLY